MVGPNGRCSISAQAWPTITGLMNSGTIRIEISSPRPRNVPTIAIASARPSRNSTATQVAVSQTVTQSEERATGSVTTCRKFRSPMKAWPGIWKS